MVWMRRGAIAAGAAACAALLWPQTEPRDPATALRVAFADPPDDCRVLMRWWWFGAAVDHAELERELRAMKDGGLGGVEIQPVYPVTVDDPSRGLANLPYLSDRFLDAVRFTNEKARELGMRVDITLGSGWPYGGPHIPIELASGRLRVERLAVSAAGGTIAMPRLGEGERVLAAFRKRAGRFERITRIDGAGVHLPQDASSGATLLVYISSRTRQTVKRAAVGAEGFVLDHYSEAALKSHLHFVGDRLMQAFGSHPPYAVFSDSLEVYGSDWTVDFLAEFQKRRGYDLTPYLPALADDMGEVTGGIRHDWGRTLTELANDHYLKPLQRWATAHGTRLRSQNYGVPPVNLSSNALVDLPEGEGSAWRHFSATRWASSASHLYRRRVTSSETWTWLHSPVFRATPLDMKAEADLHFLQGVNQLVGHGWPYSPPQAGAPGWHFYAAAVFNQQNPWWIVMPDITAYLQRVSWLLRQGEPMNDVALYLPTSDAYAEFTPGHDSVNQAVERLLGPNVIPQILDAGYDFDFVDDEAIAAVGIEHRVLVLPNVERMPAATLAKIEAFAGKGGIVIATGRLPSLAPGFHEASADTPRIQEMARALFEAPGARGLFINHDTKLAETLRGVLPPDVKAPPEIGFVHRRLLPEVHAYFLANTTNHRVHGPAVFRAGIPAETWDPCSGKTVVVPGDLRNGLTVKDLDLAPYESRIIVCYSSAVPILGPEVSPVGAPAAIMELSSGWKVTFAGAASPVRMDHLIPWIEVDGRKDFSGTATYEKTLRVGAAMLSGRRLFLDLGEGTPVSAPQPARGMQALLDSPVREAAIVYINGERAGFVWHPPYEVEVTGKLVSGENTLSIVVANLAVNRLAARHPPDHRALIARYGDRFQDQDLQRIEPLPSGMLGTVRIVAR